LAFQNPNLNTCDRVEEALPLSALEGKCDIALPTFMRSWMRTPFPPATITKKAAPLPVTAINVCLQSHYTVTGLLPQPKIEVTPMSITHELSKLFANDAHAIRFLLDSKTKKHGYRKVAQPLTPTAINEHLSGRDPEHSLGAYLLSDLENSMGHIIVFDFDDHDGDNQVQTTATAVEFSRKLDNLQCPHLIFRSGGGNGYHIYLVFEKTYPKSWLRAVGKHLLCEKAQLKEGAKGVVDGEVEIFPKGDGPGGQNVIALPLARKSVALRREDDKFIEIDPPTEIPFCARLNHIKDPGYPKTRKAKSGQKPQRIPTDNDQKIAADTVAAARDVAFRHLVNSQDANNYDVWVRIGHIMIAAFGKDDDWAFDKWVEWSQTAEDPADIDELRRKWEKDLDDVPDFSQGTFWAEAKQNGYKGTTSKNNKKRPTSVEAETELAGTYAVIRDGSKVRVGVRSVDPIFKRETWDLLTESDFMLLQRKAEAARAWLKSIDRPTYENGFVFDPTGKEHPGALNLWRGFTIKPVEGDWSTIQYHIRNVLADGNEEASRYIVNWLAWLFQNPDKQAETAIVFRGGRGTGKGMLCRAVINALGQHGIQISQPSLMTGRFNGHFRDCIALFADEAFWAGDKQGEGQLKRIITEDTLMVEAKGRDAVMVRNMLHIMIASNEDWVIPAGTDERRFAAFAVSDKHKQDSGYFTKLAAAFNGAEMQAFLHHCLNTKLNGWHPRQDIPHTAALQQQVEHSERPEVAMLRQILELGILPGTHEANDSMTSATLLFAYFRGVVRKRAFGGSVSDKAMGQLLKKHANHCHNNGRLFVGFDRGSEPLYKRVQAYEFPSLSEARQRFDPKADWPDGPGNWEYESTQEEEQMTEEEREDVPF
jgi:hypothetical protein